MSDEELFEIKPKYVSKYARPVEFVRSKTPPPPSQPESIKSNGDQVASMYRSILETSKTEKSLEGTWYCDICDLTIPESTKKSHLVGTAHLVSQPTICPAPDLLTLTSKNKGFQLLQRGGWDYDQGLGARNEGKRHPISTQLKQDRLGIGHQETTKKRVTHPYREIEKKAILRKMKMSEQKETGKQLAKKAKVESRQRVDLLSYLKN